MAMIETADVLDVGKKLRAVNAEIKAALQEMSGKKVPVDVAVALHELQKKYSEARELYTTVYRAVYGEVPTGLGVVALLGAPLWAWLTLVGMLSAAGIFVSLSHTLRVAMRAWRQGSELQTEKISVIQENLRQAEASGDTAGVTFYREQLSEVLQQPITPGILGIIPQSLVLVAAGALVLVLVMKR